MTDMEHFHTSSCIRSKPVGNVGVNITDEEIVA